MMRPFHITINATTRASILVLITWAIASSPGTSPVTAQTLDEPTELFRGRAGPYEAMVAIRPHVPMVGTIHFLVSVLDADTRKAIAGARVLIVAFDEDGSPVYQSLAVDTPASPGVYEANITFSEPGRWSLRVNLVSQLMGEASFDVPLEVRPAPKSASSAGALLFFTIIAVLVAGTAYVADTARRARRRTQSG
ncbi:FixH family protein [Dehalococcoidia bacterium]|nr:FixH family protein [Dehalococcoidia bacterium]